MKKKLIIIFLLLLCCASLFANGNTEGKEDKKVTGQYSSVGIIGRTLQGIGSTYAQATKSVVLALHPFPNILSKFYGFIDGEFTSVYDGGFDIDWMLTSENFYTNSGYTSAEKKDEFTGQEQIQIPNSNQTYVISESDVKTGKLQKTRWTITSYLFVIFFAAEVIFTAVFGYIAPQDENSSLLRQIGVSAAMTLMLFVLAAGLPFLVEAVRYGLFQIACMYTPVTFNSMFDMPAKFMWDMSYLMESLSWRNDATPIFNDGTGSSLTSSILGKLLAGLVYIVFEFVMGLQAIKAGVHIVVNVIEVYLLLSIVMVMLPISVFTPLKGVTRKCVYSLFTNLIECFVLCFIVILVVPACVTGCSNLKALNTALSNLASNTLELVAVEDLTFSTKETVEITWKLSFEAQGEDYVVLVSWVTADDSGSMTMYLSENSSLYNQYKNSNSAYNIKWADAKQDKTIKNPQYCTYSERQEYYEKRAKNIFAMFKMCTSAQYKGDPEADREYPSVSRCIEYGKLYKASIMDNSKATESNTSYNKNSTVISGLLIAWVFLYLPCFFVMQSTQITNALSSGSAGHESFANSLSHTGGQMVHAMTAAANLVKTGVSVAAGVPSAASKKSGAADVGSIQEKMQNMNNKDSGGNS